MQFVKFKDIENLETAKRLEAKDFLRAKEINYWVVTEKIDGTNIALNFDKEGN
ncbi:hypothetical protein [uncultured Mailhella sp.]|uniref:hypothetical protein n=1 Tax=uncultured Mailhella sp. TaxID=1981031 RepID=UPI00320AF7AD